MKNMGIVPYVISPKEKDVSIDETEAEAIKRKFIERTTGANAGQPIVNALPLDVTKLGSNLQEMDVSRLRMAFETRIAAVSRYPAAYLQFLVGLENGTSYASYKQAREQAFEQVVSPIMGVLGAQFTHQLLPDIDTTKGLQFFFDTSEVRVLQEDMDALFKRESETFRTGGTTIDQYLIALGKDPVGSPLGDIRFVPGMSTPTSPEKLIEDATSRPPVSAPVDPAIAKLGIGMADIDQYLRRLEEQMKEFTPEK
jgi:hypothetical protein